MRCLLAASSHCYVTFMFAVFVGPLILPLDSFSWKVCTLYVIVYVSVHSVSCQFCRFWCGFKYTWCQKKRNNAFSVIKHEPCSFNAGHCFSSAFYQCTAEPLSSCRCPSSIKVVSSHTVNRRNAKFLGKLPAHNIPRPLFGFLFFLALLDCVSRAIAVAPSSVRPSSIKRVFSETVKGINAKSCGKVAIHHISRPFFPILKILDFLILTIFFLFSLTWNPMGVKISKRYSS